MPRPRNENSAKFPFSNVQILSKRGIISRLELNFPLHSISPGKSFILTASTCEETCNECTENYQLRSAIPCIVHNSVEPVSNGEHSAVSELSPNRVLYEFISFQVHCGRGFV